MPASVVNVCSEPARELCFGRYFFVGGNSARSRSTSSMRAETKAVRVSILCFNARSVSTRPVVILGECKEPEDITQRSFQTRLLQSTLSSPRNQLDGNRIKI